MGRRTNRRDGFQSVLARIEKICESPLFEIGQSLNETVREIQRAVLHDSRLSEAALVRDVDTMLDLLPTTFGDRFRFDSAMILATSEALREIGLQLNPMIVPLHSKTWGHDSLPLPWNKGKKISMVDFILIPGNDEVGDINLLSYPFIFHEIGHNLLFRYGSIFSDNFKIDLDRITNKFRLSSIADRGAARGQAQKRIELIRGYWLPSANHKNWAYELAIDIVALWLCGPAYLAALHDKFDERHVQPYYLEQEHPPNFTRLSALVDVAAELGWSNHVRALVQLLERWKHTRWNSEMGNRNQYVALVDSQIVNACVTSSLLACKTLCLPLCNEDTVNRIRQEISRGETPDFGIDVVVGAWLVHEERGEQYYGPWESSTVRDLLKYVTL